METALCGSGRDARLTLRLALTLLLLRSASCSANAQVLSDHVHELEADYWIAGLWEKAKDGEVEDVVSAA